MVIFQQLHSSQHGLILDLLSAGSITLKKALESEAGFGVYTSGGSGVVLLEAALLQRLPRQRQSLAMIRPRLDVSNTRESESC